MEQDRILKMELRKTSTGGERENGKEA